MVKFKYFSRPLSIFQVFFKGNFIFKDFSRQSCLFKYFSILCEPCSMNKSALTMSIESAITSFQGFHLEGGGDFPLLLRHVSPATFDKFV